MPLDYVDPEEHDPLPLRRCYEAHAPMNPGTSSGRTGPEKW